MESATRTPEQYHAQCESDRNLAKENGLQWPPPKGWKEAIRQGRNPMTFLLEQYDEACSMEKLYREKSEGMPDLIITEDGFTYPPDAKW